MTKGLPSCGKARKKVKKTKIVRSNAFFIGDQFGGKSME